MERVLFAYFENTVAHGQHEQTVPSRTGWEIRTAQSLVEPESAWTSRVCTHSEYLQSKITRQHMDHWLRHGLG